MLDVGYLGVGLVHDIREHLGGVGVEQNTQPQEHQKDGQLVARGGPEGQGSDEKVEDQEDLVETDNRRNGIGVFLHSTHLEVFTQLQDGNQVQRHDLEHGLEGEGVHDGQVEVLEVVLSQKRSDWWQVVETELVGQGGQKRRGGTQKTESVGDGVDVVDVRKPQGLEKQGDGSKKDTHGVAAQPDKKLGF